MTIFDFNNFFCKKSKSKIEHRRAAGGFFLAYFRPQNDSTFFFWSSKSRNRTKKCPND